MLGRGTRKGERHPYKSHFTVFDCFDGTLLEYFRSTTGMTVEPPAGDGKSITQIIEEIWQNRDRAYNTHRLVKRLQRIAKEMSGEAIELFARFVPDGDLSRFAEDLPGLLRGSFSDTMRLVDIISMVKHAAVSTSPLLTAEERVNQAVDRVTSGRQLSTAEAKWMEYIRQHLVANLSIEREDFEAIPVLSDHGGWGRADRVFRGHLAQILEQLNEELVAA